MVSPELKGRTKEEKAYLRAHSDDQADAAILLMYYARRRGYRVAFENSRVTLRAEGGELIISDTLYEKVTRRLGERGAFDNWNIDPARPWEADEAPLPPNKE